MQQVSRIDPASMSAPNQSVAGPGNLVNVISGQGLPITGQNILHAGQPIHLSDQQQHQMHQQFYFQSPCQTGSTSSKMIPDSHQISVIGPPQGTANLQVYPATMTSGGSLQLHSSTPNLINTSFATAVATGATSNHGGGTPLLLQHHAAQHQTHYQIAQTGASPGATVVQVQHPQTGQIIQEHHHQIHPASQHLHQAAALQHTRLAAAPLTVQHLTATPASQQNLQQAQVSGSNLNAINSGSGLGVACINTSSPATVPVATNPVPPPSSSSKKRRTKKPPANATSNAQLGGLSPASGSSSLSSSVTGSTPTKSQQQNYFNSGDMTAAPNDLTLLVQQAMYPSVLPDSHHHYTPPPSSTSPRRISTGGIVYTATATTSGGTTIVQIPASTPDQTGGTQCYQTSQSHNHVNNSNVSNTLYVNQASNSSISNLHNVSLPNSTGVLFQATNTVSSVTGPTQQRAVALSTGGTLTPPASMHQKMNQSSFLTTNTSNNSNKLTSELTRSLSMGSHPQAMMDSNDFVVTFLSSSSTGNSNSLTTSTPNSTLQQTQIYPTPTESRSSVDDLLTNSFLQNDADTATSNSNAISDFIDEDECKDFLERIYSPGSASISAAPSPAPGSSKTKMDMEKLDSTIDLVMEYVHSDHPHLDIFVLPNRCLPPKPTDPTPPPAPLVSSSSSQLHQVNSLSELMGPPSATMAISVTSSPVRQLQCAIPAVSPAESPSSIFSGGSSTVYSISGGGGAKSSAIQPQQAQLIQHQYITSAGVPMTSYIVDQIGPAQHTQGAVASPTKTTNAPQTVATQRVLPSGGGYSSTIYLQQSQHPQDANSSILVQHPASQLHFSPHPVGVKVGNQQAQQHHIIMQPTSVSPHQQQRISLVGQQSSPGTVYTVPKPVQDVPHQHFLSTHRPQQQQTQQTTHQLPPSLQALNKPPPQNTYVPSSTPSSGASGIPAQSTAASITAPLDDAKVIETPRDIPTPTSTASTPVASTGKKRPNCSAKSSSSSSKRRKPNSAASQAEQQKQLNDAQALYDELVEKLKKDPKSLLGLIHQPVIPTSSLVVLPVLGSSCDAKFVWNSDGEESDWLEDKGFKYCRYPFSLKCPKPDTSLLMDVELNDSLNQCNVSGSVAPCASHSSSLNTSMEAVEQIQLNENKFILQHLSVAIPDGPLLHSNNNKSISSKPNGGFESNDCPLSPICRSPIPQTFESSIKLLLNNTKLLCNQQVESAMDAPAGGGGASFTALRAAQSLEELIPLEDEAQSHPLMRAFQSNSGAIPCNAPGSVYNLERSTPPLSMFHLPNKELLEQLKVTHLLTDQLEEETDIQELLSEPIQHDTVSTKSLYFETPNSPFSLTQDPAAAVHSPPSIGPLLTASETEQLHQALLQKEITPITISTTHSAGDASGVSTVQVTINGVSRSSTDQPGPSHSDMADQLGLDELGIREHGGGAAASLSHGSASPIVDSETGEVLGMKQSSSSTRTTGLTDGSSEIVASDKEKLHLSFTLSPKSADNIQKMVKNITDMLGINFNSVNYQVTRTDLNTEITVNQNNPIQPQKFQELEQQIRKQIAPLTWRMNQEQSQMKEGAMMASSLDASTTEHFTSSASATMKDNNNFDLSTSTVTSVPSVITAASPGCGASSGNLPPPSRHEEEHLSIPDLRIRCREEDVYCRHCEVKLAPNCGIKRCLNDYRTESGLAFKSDPDGDEMSFCSLKCLNGFIQELTEASMCGHRFKEESHLVHHCHSPATVTGVTSSSFSSNSLTSSPSVSCDSAQTQQNSLPPPPPSHVIEYRQQFFNVPVVLQGPPPRYPKSSLAKRQNSLYCAADSFSSSGSFLSSGSFNAKHNSRKKNFSRPRKWRGHRWKSFNVLSLSNTVNQRKVKGETSAEEMKTLIRDYSGALKYGDSDCVDSRVCLLCKIRGDAGEDGPGRLLCLDIDVFIHLNCALWCYEVYETLGGSLNSVSTCSSKALINMCSYCGLYGAGLPCYNPRCSVVYHLPCAQAAGCMFFTDRGMYCQLHQPKEHQMQLKTLSVNRRVYISRDENHQVAQVIHEDADGSHHLVRIGSLILHNLGQLLPHQIESGNYHTIRYIYPVGFKTSRIYWSTRRPQKRCIYQCRIVEKVVYETESDQRASADPSLPNPEGGDIKTEASLNESNASSGQAIHKPEFVITVIGEDDLPDIEFRDYSCDAVWKQILNKIKSIRMENHLVKMFPQHLVGEELFGLTEPHILRAIESLPGVENLRDYAFKFGRLQLISEMPLAINPSGCARSEPKMRTYFRRARYAQSANMICGSSSSSIRHAANSASTSAGHHYLIPHLSWSGEQTLYGKQYISSRSQQYKKLKHESKNNVILGRSRIQGLGLFAGRDLEKYTMVIEYIGQVIRCELGNKREKEYEAHNRGTYMFRLDDNYIVDATVTGGLARYINHSCQPNCVAEIVNFERESHIIIFANKRIERGEELTYDYKFDYEDSGNKISCLCGAVSCRKWMN